MSVALSRTRVVLRAAVATAALAGALCTPALAFAAGHGSATAVANGTSGSSADCTVTKTMPSAILGMTVTLTNSTAGPSADLKDDESGKTVATVNRSHPEDLAAGLRITGADTATPLFLDRSQGGNTPWRTTPFPTLPTSCTDTGTGTETGTPEETGTGTAQTKVVPAGGVAAGAEGVEETDGTMVAGGAAVAAAGLLGLGFAVRSRRGARSGA